MKITYKLTNQLNSMIESQSQKWEISWNNINLKLKSSSKVILNDISARVKSGQFLSIMGPSGAGKSSLLSIICCRITNNSSQYILSGKTNFNNLQYDLTLFNHFAGYVRQQDILMSTLTVYETFEFQVGLRLFYRSQKEQQQIINKTITDLNLNDVKTRLIGGLFQKCLSGGQIKRVAIGLQLISNPRCLILDEPTSGLDSHNALIIIRLLNKLCQQSNKIIIATIHQPSSIVFSQMDKIMMIKDGNCIFNDKAANLVKYMQHIGVNINYKMNPADQFMTEIRDAKNKDKISVQQFRKYNSILNGTIQSSRYKYIQKSGISERPQVSLQKQIISLLLRATKCQIRNPFHIAAKIVTSIILPLILGFLYLQIGEDIPINDSKFNTFLTEISCLFFMCTFTVFGNNVYNTTLLFPQEKYIVFKEAGSNLYSINSYFIVKLFIEFVGSVIIAIFASIIIYFLCAFELNFHHLLIFSANFMLCAVSGATFGMLIGIVFQDERIALNLVPLFIMPLALVGGLIVNLKDIPIYISWMQYISVIRYSYSIFVIDQFSSDKMHNIWGNQIIREKIGFEGSVEESFIYLSILTFATIIFCLILINYSKKFI